MSTSFERQQTARGTCQYRLQIALFIDISSNVIDHDNTLRYQNSIFELSIIDECKQFSSREALSIIQLLDQLKCTLRAHHFIFFYKIRHNYGLRSANDLKFSGYISETITNNFLADSLPKSKIRNRPFQFEINKLKSPHTNFANKQLITQILINSNNFFTIIILN